jgi:HAD superfamily hydrolase (TIGR01509 family)
LPDLIIYDCDGTLIDSERVVADICLTAIHELGLSDWTMNRYIETFIGMPGHVGWSRVQEALGKPLPQGLNERVDAEIVSKLATTDLALPGVRQAITAIGGERCVASSTPLDHLRHNIGLAKLDDLFGDAIFSASQVKRAKPAPDVFLLAAARMGHDPNRCIVIEDSVPGVTAARRAGMQVIGYTGAAHDPALMDERLAMAGAYAVVSHMNELPAVVASIRARAA